jgi:hypothetical protein
MTLGNKVKFIRYATLIIASLLIFKISSRAQSYARVSLVIKHKDVKLDDNFIIYFIRKDSICTSVIKPKISKDSFQVPDILMDDADKYYFVLKYKGKMAMLICDRYVYDCHANWRVFIEDDPIDYGFLHDKIGKLFKVDDNLVLKKYSRLCFLEIDSDCEAPILYRTGIANITNAEIFIRHLLYL